MKIDEVLNLIADGDFLDKIYGFSYRRCDTTFDAEDLCSEIIVKVISAVNKQNDVGNFYAFVWTIARRVYADFCDKRNKLQKNISLENNAIIIYSKTNEIDNFIEKSSDTEYLKRIFEELSYLSKSYRDVMVMYYIDEMKIKDIANALKISENTVKQRLFFARNIIKKEVETMTERKLSLKPVKLAISGTGDPCGNDPRSKVERIFSQNLVYLCKNKPKTAKELSDELCIPMPYIEEELEIQCRGENGQYGFLRKLNNGKYALNILLADYEEYDSANKIYEKYLSEFCKILMETLQKYKMKILEFPYLSKQNNISFILWSLISRTVWNFEDKINKVIAEKYFNDIIPAKRKFSCAAVAYRNEQKQLFDFYGCDGINATLVGGYKSVYVSNIYGKRIEKHFHCGHNLSQDEKLLILLKAIKGLSIYKLNENEKEIAAKAVECGYLRKIGNLLEPKIIIINKESENEFYKLSYDLNENMGALIESIANELSRFMKEHIPEYLINDYQIYTQLIAGTRILSDVINECINTGTLSVPEKKLGAEGVLMIVEK